MLERGQLRIPHRDKDETLARQMTNYQVVRYSSKTGEATYSDTDEHALDGLMFTLYGFIMHKPELANTVMERAAARTIAKMKKKVLDPFIQQERESQVKEESELRQPTVKIRKRRQQNEGISWGRRGSGGNRMPSRKGW